LRIQQFQNQQKMTTKTKNIVNWSLAGLVGFIFIGSAVGKFMASAETVAMAESIGLSASTFGILGAVELVSVLLFIVPRTGLLGTLLLTAYMGGAMATHLTHQLPLTGPMVILAIIWIAATVRFPEMSTRLFAKQA
jgi:hypothetical protein